jgi:hypothetical protein
MNKIYGFLFLAILLFTSGCKQDEVVVPTTLQNTNLLGKWYLTELIITPEDPTASSDTLNDFTDKDFFEFKPGSAATFSSTIYAKVYEGYYSVNSSVNPQVLSFKSGNLLLRYFVESVDSTTFTVFEARTETQGGVPVTTLYHYTYSRLP